MTSIARSRRLDSPQPLPGPPRHIATPAKRSYRLTGRPANGLTVPSPGSRVLVHVVDADCARRAAIARELYDQSIHVEIYESAEELIRRAPSQGLMLVHADHCDSDEGEFIQTLRQRTHCLPVAFYCPAPSPERIVDAMVSGAVDYLQWPVPNSGLAARVMRMAGVGAERTRLEARRLAAVRRVEALTKRESDVLVRLIEGDSNKEIALYLGISPRTVEIHRAGMLARLDARSTADAVRIGLCSGLLD